jgi:glycosyltransferase involved in cell wall biosynthesis
MLFLKILYKCPFVGYFEWMPPPFWSPELAQRMDYPPPDDVRLCQALDHTLTLLHLRMVEAAYTPTEFQYGISPPELRHKIQTIHDGIDTEYYKRRPIQRPTSFRGIPLSADTKIVTYVSPGLESWRGFDIFMKMAKRICDERSDVIFLIAGEERTQYGYELNHIGPQSFKQYVLSQDNYDLSRFHFLGIIPTQDLVTLFSLSDMHVYLTIPFVLSWSLMQAMSAGCTILSSATPPVMEMIEHGKHGLLSEFYDVDTLTRHAREVLRDPEAYRHLGVTARNRILEKYEKSLCIRQMVKLFESVTKK